MNAIKRKMILKILATGHSAVNKANAIGRVINQPEDDILRILQAAHWDKKIIMGYLDMFSTARNNIQYVDSLGRNIY